MARPVSTPTPTPARRGRGCLSWAAPVAVVAP